MKWKFIRQKQLSFSLICGNDAEEIKFGMTRIHFSFNWIRPESRSIVFSSLLSQLMLYLCTSRATSWPYTVTADMRKENLKAWEFETNLMTGIIKALNWIWVDWSGIKIYVIVNEMAGAQRGFGNIKWIFNGY